MDDVCRYAKSISCCGTRSWYAVTPMSASIMCTIRVSRGRRSRPLSAYDIVGNAGSAEDGAIVVVVVAGCEGGGVCIWVFEVEVGCGCCWDAEGDACAAGTSAGADAGICTGVGTGLVPFTSAIVIVCD